MSVCCIEIYHICYQFIASYTAERVSEKLEAIFNECHIKEDFDEIISDIAANMGKPFTKCTEQKDVLDEDDLEEAELWPHLTLEDQQT